MPPTKTLLALTCLLLSTARLLAAPPEKPTDKPTGKASESQSETVDPRAGKWKSLFDGKTLKGWKATQFGGEGEVHVQDGMLMLEMGVDLTGVTWQDAKALPKLNYELELEAKRVVGSDFFCGLTFPVGDDPCSLIIGGWGGGVCGLSSIDGMDASENETTTYRGFEKDRWYRIRLRVTDGKIEAWLDDKLIVEQETKGRKISIRGEVDLSRPLGIASWQTAAALRNIRVRPVKLEAAQVK